SRRFMDFSRNFRMERDRFTTAIAASEQADLYRQAGKVWVMYVMPFIIPITAGLAVTLGVGDVVQILLHL
ncbi:MAG: A24 family peptidase C-terminal domain-containing protein, partial [Desulfobacterales bacterium]|nr:A24 family peptidase C-terminal domain-containing protein [Desulfobacterales bacterium]